MRKLALGTALVALLFGGFVLIFTALQARPPGAAGEKPPSPGATEGMPAGGPSLPPVKGFAEGQEIRFIHTEASDPQVADMLTRMMNSPVLVVPSLAQAPESMLANVYVFANGVKGEGPFGFQPDVFDQPPGAPGYRPLRAVHLVRWKSEAAARVLKSAAEVREAEVNAEITIERTGAVVNMPFVVWQGGQR